MGGGWGGNNGVTIGLDAQAKGRAGGWAVGRKRGLALDFRERHRGAWCCWVRQGGRGAYWLRKRAAATCGVCNQLQRAVGAAARVHMRRAVVRRRPSRGLACWRSTCFGTALLRPAAPGLREEHKGCCLLHSCKAGGCGGRTCSSSRKGGEARRGSSCGSISGSGHGDGGGTNSGGDNSSSSTANRWVLNAKVHVGTPARAPGSGWCRQSLCRP